MFASQDIEPIKSNIKRPRILIVEQDELHWTWIQQAMAEVWSEVLLVRASTRSQVHKLAKEWVNTEWEIPKLILADLDLPDQQEGWRLLSELRMMEEPFNQLPIITMSQVDSLSAISASYRLGCSAYLVKPGSVSEWLACLRPLRAYWWDLATTPILRLGL
ncbi:response regulator [uncultured Fibrella sp.]|uniref:response regulator n=1 Tax=uncultured Fibrella sp. TaxID=1284596 RepID=UPI0035CC0EF4